MSKIGTLKKNSIITSRREQNVKETGWIENRDLRKDFIAWAPSSEAVAEFGYPFNAGQLENDHRYTRCSGSPS
jgi:hypothetical protein